MNSLVAFQTAGLAFHHGDFQAYDTDVRASLPMVDEDDVYVAPKFSIQPEHAIRTSQKVEREISRILNYACNSS